MTTVPPSTPPALEHPPIALEHPDREAAAHVESGAISGRPDASARSEGAPARAIRQVSPDVTSLKALAHPVRLRLLGLLRIDGPATATQLAERLGLNSGATSYHLRQLAQHGYIEEAASANRRDRLWQARHELTTFEETGEAGAEATAAFVQAALVLQTDMMRQAAAELADLPAVWRAACTASDMVIPLTPAAATALVQKLEALLTEAMQAAPPLGQPLPADTVPFTLMLHAFPFPGRLPHRDAEA
ncbi:winged helix-turn-helix domain-containing protein [Oryzibacter oryziterrae]|uniref:winged helix-turn-helix domain-containing protein n=1 Tax=Oryzibacter oryziterrae TaxID=2766474 RepID=UPI001F1A4322|nr:winged helix-turn-helix domain-containing protein [Oryzibacter oryziterrae]